MRKTVRLFSEMAPHERLGEAIAALPVSAQQALADVAEHTELPLVAGSWHDGASGCLVANVVALEGARRGATSQGSGDSERAGDPETTLDMRILELLPQMSSRDLNNLIVAWDTAAEQDASAGDAELRQLLRAALRRAGVPAPGIRPARDGREVRTERPMVSGAVR